MFWAYTALLTNKQTNRIQMFNPSLKLILAQLNPGNTFTFCLWKIIFNIFLPYMQLDLLEADSFQEGFH
jgi:hypothetical protein